MPDISRGVEAIPVLSRNDWDDETMPSGYDYIRDLLQPSNVPLLQDAPGCGRGGKTLCWAVPLQTSHSGSLRQGWSAFAAQDIPAGAFVCQYAGELISNAETQQRLIQYDVSTAEPGHALLVIREVLPSLNAAVRINVDATRNGNVARFMNHSCDGGNLEPVVVRMQGCFTPHIGMYARRPIREGEELTFAYGRPYGGPSEGVPGQASFTRAPRRCMCRTAACLGYLPCELV